MLRLAPVPTAPADARQAVAKWLAAQGTSGPPADDALLVVSELVTNGVIHDGGDHIALRAEHDGRCLTVTVVTTPRRPGVAAYERPAVGPDETGRGLGVVAAVCKDVLTHHQDAGARRTVCRLDLHG